MFALPTNFREFLQSQFTPLPYPEGDFGGKTIIVTGANCGLGLEAARHFVRLNAAKVILACRSQERGEVARKDIEQTTQRQGVVEVWQVDLTSFESVKQFCARASRDLERLDVVVENAGIATGKFELYEGYESTVTVNVISTFLMALLLLPKLRETATKYNVLPRLTIVSSDAHQMANFHERIADEIFTALNDASARYQTDRYNVSKLLEVLVVRELAPAITTPAQMEGKAPVILNTVNPGFCVSQIQRNGPFWVRFLLWLAGLLLARTAEMGSRTLLAGSVAGWESHGRYMHDCKVREPSAFVRSEEGERTQRKVSEELMDILERIEPGITRNI